MFWPGMGDPVKRKKTLKFLVLTAGVGISVGLGSIFIQQWANADNPLRVCIDDRDTTYKISATVELYVNGQKAEIPANIGIADRCTHSIYTLSNDGTIYAEWDEEYPFEIGHFFWTWTTYHDEGFPMRDMKQDKSKIFVNGILDEKFFGAPLIDGNHYRAEFFSKDYESSKDSDFLPPDI